MGFLSELCPDVLRHPLPVMSLLIFYAFWMVVTLCYPRNGGKRSHSNYFLWHNFCAALTKTARVFTLQAYFLLPLLTHDVLLFSSLLILVQPEGLSCNSTNKWDILLPEDLCTQCLFYLELSLPRYLHSFLSSLMLVLSGIFSASHTPYCFNFHPPTHIHCNSFPAISFFTSHITHTIIFYTVSSLTSEQKPNESRTSVNCVAVSPETVLKFSIDIC